MSDRLVRMITTANSLWVLDFVNMEFQRLPRHEGSKETTMVAYCHTDWTPFLGFSQSVCPDDIPELVGRVRFVVNLSATVGDWITSTYDPKDQ